ncbi:MAG: OmpH family outer membrane protein [Bacteroidaceae bacterium]|nr:OmpH family outer membrane protein [Bacteroidaceae bacterium]
MKRFSFFFITAAMLLIGSTQSRAQKISFGYLNYTEVLQSMTEYATAQSSMNTLREQYDKEAIYNEDKFFKMYSEYIQGQKSFPEDIMLKRQKELQVAMDQGIKFREDSEKLLRKAESELISPIEQKLDSAIAVVARTRNLAFVLNREGHACPYVNPADGIDITPLVKLVLAGQPLPKEELVKVEN